MRHPLRLLTIATGLVAFQTGSAAQSTHANPYSGIARQNPFRLVAPSVSPPPVQTELRPAQKIRLAGISSVGGHACALLEVQELNSEKVTRPILQEREEFADMKILAIDPVAGAVRVRIGGKSEKLVITSSFWKDTVQHPH
jgi:hypothetical protein